MKKPFSSSLRFVCFLLSVVFLGFCLASGCAKEEEEKKDPDFYHGYIPYNGFVIKADPYDVYTKGPLNKEKGEVEISPLIYYYLYLGDTYVQPVTGNETNIEDENLVILIHPYYGSLQNYYGHEYDTWTDEGSNRIAKLFFWDIGIEGAEPVDEYIDMFKATVTRKQLAKLVLSEKPHPSYYIITWGEAQIYGFGDRDWNDIVWPAS